MESDVSNIKTETYQDSEYEEVAIKSEQMVVNESSTTDMNQITDTSLKISNVFSIVDEKATPPVTISRKPAAKNKRSNLSKPHLRISVTLHHRANFVHGLRFECNLCHRLMSTYILMSNHRLKHAQNHSTANSDYQCRHCKVPFYNAPYLRKHMRSVHNDPNVFHCRRCNSHFPTIQLFHKHRNPGCQGGYQFECMYCGIWFDTYKEMLDHCNNNFPCMFCDEVFNDLIQLETHEKKHITKINNKLMSKDVLTDSELQDIKIEFEIPTTPKTIINHSKAIEQNVDSELIPATEIVLNNEQQLPTESLASDLPYQPPSISIPILPTNQSMSSVLGIGNFPSTTEPIVQQQQPMSYLILAADPTTGQISLLQTTVADSTLQPTGAVLPTAVNGQQPTTNTVNDIANTKPINKDCDYCQFDPKLISHHGCPSKMSKSMLQRFTKNVRLRHPYEGHKPKPFTSFTMTDCKACKTNFQSFDELRNHSCAANYRVCRFCGKCISPHNLQGHEDLHLGIKRFNCDVCSTKVGTIGSLMRHLRGVHNKCYRCMTCPNAFSRIENIKSHLLDIHQICMEKQPDSFCLSTSENHSKRSSSMATDQNCEDTNSNLIDLTLDDL